MRNLEYCDKCLPEKNVPAMGYIPIPAMSHDTLAEERKILLCNDHYFEAKKDCYYVVPFDRDHDPVDSFLSRVNQKHKLLRGTLRLKFSPKSGSNGYEEPLPPAIVDIAPKLSRQDRSTEKKGKIHYRDSDYNLTVCGHQVAKVPISTETNSVTCKNCLAILKWRAEQTMVHV